MLFRKFTKALLGKATPFHLVLSCLFGAWAGFGLAFADAPAFWVTFVALLALLPANLGLVGIFALVLYPLSLLLMPVSFHAGRFLLDGPTRPLFEFLINAPYTALMGFEFYAHTGGLFVGTVLGGVLGWLVVKGVRALRHGYQNMDQNSERFHKWASKWWVGLLTWALLGARPKTATYEKLEGKRVGKPVRPAGAILAVVLVAAFLWIGHQLSGPILTRSLRTGLEEANGATVDLKNAAISLADARVAIDALAMADPNALTKDLLRGLKLDADLGVGDLLTGRFHVEKIVLTQASSGAERETPGELVGEAPGEGGAGDGDAPAEEEKTLDDYLSDAKKWRERLAQVRNWLDRLSGQPDPEDGGEEGLNEKLERWVATRGYATATAAHLIEGRPKLSIGELRIEGLEAMQVDGKPFDIVGENLSTHPHLLDATPRLSIKARDGSFVFDLALGAAAKGGGENRIDFVMKGISGDAIGKRLKVGKTQVLAGGTIDLSTQGTWHAQGTVDLPFQITLNGTTLTLPGGQSERIERLELPLKLYGPLGNPRVLFRDEDLTKALIAAGKKQLAGKLAENLPEGAAEKLDEAKGLLDRLKKR